MKKPYQIESQRAVKRLEEMAAEGNPAVQMMLPMADIVGWLRQGVGELIRQAGLQLVRLLMEEEVRELVGERSQPQAERKANRWGSERGLLRGDGTEAADRTAARALHRSPGSTAGTLRAVPSRRVAPEPLLSTKVDRFLHSLWHQDRWAVSNPPYLLKRQLKGGVRR